MPKLHPWEENFNQFGYINMKDFCPQKTLLKNKRQDTDWEKIVANCISDKELYPEFIKNSNTITTTKK